MTLIIYAVCKDAKILIMDRQEGFSISNAQDSVKYHYTKDQSIVIGFSATNGNEIDKFYSEITTKEPISTQNIRVTLHEIVKNGSRYNVNEMGESGCMIVKNNEGFQFYDLTLFRDNIAIKPGDMSIRCIGDDNAVALSYPLMNESNISEEQWEIAVQKMIAIMEHVAKYNTSVGQVELFGFDAFIFKNNQTVLHHKFEQMGKTMFKPSFEKEDSGVINVLFKEIKNE